MRMCICKRNTPVYCWSHTLFVGMNIVQFTQPFSAWGDPGPRLTRGSTWVHNPNGISIGYPFFCSSPMFHDGAVHVTAKLPIPQGDRDHRLIHAHPSPHAKRHLDRFIRFCRAHGCNQQTGTQTHAQTDSRGLYICSKRPISLHCVHAMRPNSG